MLPSGLKYESVQILDENEVDITAFHCSGNSVRFAYKNSRLTSMISLIDIPCLLPTSVETDYINSLSTSGNIALVQVDFSNASLFQTQNGLESQKKMLLIA